MKINKKKLTTELRDYLMITIAMVCYCIGWTVFLLPNNITTGGVPGVSSVIYWGFGIPVQTTYFIINAILLLIALKILGWRVPSSAVVAWAWALPSTDLQGGQISSRLSCTSTATYLLAASS